MSPTSLPPASRSLVATAVLTLAALAAPAAAQAQSGVADRALLNRAAIGSIVRPALPRWSAEPTESAVAVADGERALLARTEPGPHTESAGGKPLNAERALLGRYLGRSGSTRATRAGIPGDAP